MPSSGEPDVLARLLDAEANDRDFTLPFFNYMGPGTHIVDKLLNHAKPINRTDEIAREHDFNYTIKPGYVDKMMSDLYAIKRGITEKTEGPLDSLSRIALVGGLALKTSLAFSPASLLYHAAFGDNDKTSSEKEVLTKLYTSNLSTI